MAKLIHDAAGEHFYETGVQECVLYPVGAETTHGTHKTKYSKGVAWNGITTVTESPSGAEATPLYADNRKYLNLISAEDFGMTIEAYTYPDEFAECDGSASVANVAGLKIGQQPRKMFGLCYKTFVGNDEAAADGSHYKLHLVYGCMAAPSERAYATVNETPEAITMSWEVTTTPVDMAGFKPLAHIEVESTATKIADLIAALYGTDGTGSGTGTDAYLPMPDEVAAILSAT